MPNDAWTSFLRFLSTIITPSWDDLIRLMPLFVIVGVLGPALSLLVLYHLYHFVKRSRPRIQLQEAEASAAPLGEGGMPVIPPNVPHCSKHGLIYPLDATVCELDREELSVRCPVDDVVRSARQQLCKACGTRYILGASNTAIMVRRAGRPPEGGAAAA